eukprot:CAMPEP_0172308820 /NCGR_PEP_ID=MMETSP1058-20130122/9299_1 /TAXON_ID=83371 /ORGANISM="Detonula confervacea, Strain CCMP 353" /LENGTH=1849 /DNA_ID=CAMNT_0013021327 /DNA_START=27 /DNA_END=5573 /DNA_ORIENTATION=+
MMSATPTALPSLEECTAVLSTCLKNDHEINSIDKWRTLIQTCLSHGTNYDQLHNTANTNNDDEHDKEKHDDDEMKEQCRAEESGTLLANALEWYLIQLQKQNQQAATNNDESNIVDITNGDNTPPSSSMMMIDIQRDLKDNPVICAVVEALWLVGCLLESSEDDSTPATSTAIAAGEDAKNTTTTTTTTLKQIPYQSLLIILRHLVTPRPWLIAAGRVGNHDIDHEDKEASAEKNKDAMQVDEPKEDALPTATEAISTTTTHAHPQLLLPLLPLTSLQTCLELPLLQAANLLPHPLPTAAKKAPKSKALAQKAASGPAGALAKKLKKMNTDMYYRQHKFNLLQEESEGYAKLLGFLVLGLKDDNVDNEKKDGDGNGGGHVDGVGGVGNDGEHNAKATKYVRELIGAFDLDPNRVLDLSLDTLEWELNAIVKEGVGSTAKEAVGGSKSSFAELSKLANGNKGGEDGASWWGLEQLRKQMMNADGEKVVVIHSLLAIIRELDGNTNGCNDDSGNKDTCQGGRAVAHLLGFKYRSYQNRAVSIAAVAAAKHATQTTSDGKAATTVTAASGNIVQQRNVYPRSLYLSTAFLCAHDVLDVHALIPHLVANNTAAVAPSKVATTKAAAPVASKPPAAIGAKSETTTAATSLMQTYQTYCTNTIKRLKKMGVVSLNSSNKSSDKDKKDATATKREGGDFGNDPIIGIFRALLALVGDWDTCVAFLANGTVPDFCSLVQQTKNDEEDGNKLQEEKLRSAMDSAVLAACTLCEGVALDVCAWVNGVIGDVYTELYPSSLNSRKQRSNNKKSLSILPCSSKDSFVLSKDSSLEKMSCFLKGPLSSLVKSGKIRMNQNLYVKLCRLYKHKLATAMDTTACSTDPTSSTTNMIDDDTLSVLSTFLVPSLSLFPSDTTLPTELWAVLQKLPYTIRYKLYAAWRFPGLEKGTLRSLPPSAIKAGAIPKPLGIIESEIDTGIAARYVLKRISKDNIKDMGSKLAKTSHNNPLVVFTDILSKIESYDNLILMMVDTFEFVTELGLDVMGYCLLVSLGGGEEEVGGGSKGRTKMRGLNTEQWLASLETFTGAFYKKFPNVELRGILVYITKRFKEGQNSELGVLRTLIKTAGGYGFVDYDSTAALSDLQLDGRCGSRMLKRETSSFGVVDDINRKASQQLRSVLQGGDLGVIILILLSQIRSRVLYSKSSDMVKEHVKVIGNKYDDCEAVMCLLLEYLADTSDDSKAKEKFAASMPSLLDLHEKYGVDTAVAWMLCRPLVRKSMFYMDDSKLASKASPAYLKPFASSPEMTSSYQSLLPEAAWKHITPSMFEVFYSLHVYDITCPAERYNVDTDRLKKDCERLTQLQKGGEAARGQMSVLAAAAAAAGGNQDQIRQATTFSRTHAVELDRLKHNVDQLSKDFQRQQKRCKVVLSKLEAQKESLIGPDKEVVNSSMFAQSFMTFCIYPRCFLSPEDALFCAHFVKLLHKIKVPGFLTVELIDNIVNSVTGSLYCMTEDEAGNCSIFFNEIWKSVNSWRYDNDAFASELKNTPGSQLSKEFAQEYGIEDHSLTGGITHDDYKAIYSQWHQKIGSAAIGCLKSSEYMHTRAALIVLSRIVLIFPTQPKTGDKILKTLGPLQGDGNERPDIRATAQGYCSQLTKARDEGVWKEENIAVTKARQEREKTKAEERKKKLAQQHEDMKKETEVISRQLGDGRDGWRPDRRDERREDRGRPRGMDPRVHSRAPPLSAIAPKFTPKSGGESRDLHGRPGESRKPGMERDTWERDRSGRQSDSRDSRRPSGETSRGERRKRSRSPEPGEDTERSTQKRTRGDRDWAPHRRDAPSSDQQQSSRGGGPRRSDRRGGSS